jgi:hypothetical protein
MPTNDEGPPATNGKASENTNSDASILANDTPPPAEGFSFKDWVERGKCDQRPDFNEFLNPTSHRPATPPTIDTSDHARAYAAAVLDGEARKVAATPEGSRNHALNAAGLRAYRTADAAGVERQVVTDTMTNAGLAAGLDSSEVAGTLRSAAAGADRHGPADIPDGDTNGLGDTTFHAEADDDDGPPMLAARLLNQTALQALPDPEPLIADTLDQGTVALIYGKWGTFKSFLALDWAASVATGHAWQGRDTEQRRVLYVAAEGAYGLKARFAAWQSGWRTTIGDDNLSILPHPVNLNRPAEVANLSALVAWGGYGLVVLDTLARCMVGADENSAQDCGVVVDTLVRLRQATPGGRGVVLGVHHTGKDGKTFRGSSVFEAGADTVYSMTRDGGTVALNREKRKDGPETDQHELQLDLVPGTDSGVLSRFHQGGGNTDRHDRLLSIYRHHFSATGATRADLRRVAEMSDGTFYRAIGDLLKRGVLVNYGTDRMPFYKEA